MSPPHQQACTEYSYQNNTSKKYLNHAN